MPGLHFLPRRGHLSAVFIALISGIPGCNFRHPAGDKNIVLFLEPPGSCLPVFHKYIDRQAAAFEKNLLQDAGQLIAFGPRQHGILYTQVEPALLREGKLRIFKHAVKKMAVFLQLKQYAVPVNFHELFRVILGREAVFFMNFYGDIAAGKQLLLNFTFHRKNIILLYQPLTA